MAPSILLQFGVGLAVAMMCMGWAEGLAWSCPFNKLCSCVPPEEPGRPPYPDIPNSGALVQNVSCFIVPFRRMPDLPAVNLTSVRVRGGGLTEMERNSLGGARIVSLDLSNNRLYHIDPYTFQHNGGSLVSLDLSNNEFLEIPGDSFEPLFRLRILTLDSNRIIDVNVDWKNVADSLHKLSLSKNGIFHLSQDSRSLAEFKRLSWLSLDNNFLQTIENKALPRGLETLILSRNIFKMFPSALLKELRNLKQIILRDNYIDNLDIVVESLEGNKSRKLEKIDLGENEIVMVENLFSGSQIKDLQLDGNALKNIPPNMFKGLNCNRINLARNRIELVDDRAFYGLGNSLEKLDLSFNKLINATKAMGLLKRLKMLSLEGNGLQKIAADTFPHASDVAVIRLAHNQLTAIPKPALKSLRGLKHLDLSYNHISNISETDFLIWGENLNILELVSNGIHTLKESALKSLKQLKVLNLSFNKISKLDEKCLAHLSESLERLEIRFGLKSDNLPEAEIKPLRSLVWLSLDFNNFKNVSRTALYNFGNIQHVNLEGNKLSDIHDTFFHANVHKNLRDIRLGLNNLKVIKFQTFSGLRELQSIALNDNKIGFIDKFSFHNLPNSLIIILSDNLITNIAPNAFVNIKSLQKLDLQGNLLTNFSLNIFQNVTNDYKVPMHLNLSRNLIANLSPSPWDSLIIEVIDLNRNELREAPVNFLFSIKKVLKKLYLNDNKIQRLDNRQFHELEDLEILEISGNGIHLLKPKCFYDLKQMQILDLSRNQIEVIHSSQFKNLENLRILNLSFNRLKSIPNDAFKNTKLEEINLSHNELFVAPTPPLAVISFHLRILDLSYNKIEHIDSSTFANTPFVTHLSLCNNKLTYLPDNILRNILSLDSLELCGNKLQLNFKDLFQFAQNLHNLNLADIGLKVVPEFSLPNLAYLNLSKNMLSEIQTPTIGFLPNLRSLDLSSNNLSSLNGISWNLTKKLEYLDISNNPIKIITRNSFTGLESLKELNVQQLPLLERFDTNTLSDSRFITWLKIQTWPNIERYRFRLERILSKLKHLRRLSILVTEDQLFDQLGHGFTRKLEYLEITGKQLRLVHHDCLAGAEPATSVTIHIHDTSLQDLPDGFFTNWVARHLTVDLSNNRFASLRPSVFYRDPSRWRDNGTTPFPGGINLEGNPLECSCANSWLGEWSRRHLVESRAGLPLDPLSPSLDAFRHAKRIVCFTAGGLPVPLVKFQPSCPALTSRSPPQSTLPHPVLSLFFTYILTIYIKSTDVCKIS